MSSPCFNQPLKKNVVESPRVRWVGRKGGFALLWVSLILSVDMADWKQWASIIQGLSAGPPAALAEPGNRLAREASPYLREAAKQPVHWFPWDEEAFRLAQQEGKPILLDIGAVWCHWCHVMDVESYENEEIARLINRHFVAIKVDRDERPDIDRRYQQAVQALSGSGGWPLTAFLTPGGDVFYGGTYFPPEDREDRGDRPGLKTLLPQIAELYETRKAEIVAAAEQLSKGLRRFAKELIRGEEFKGELVEIILGNMVQRFDSVNGGFGPGAKFPAGSAIELALARYFTDRDPKVLEIATKTLDAMAHGGIHDHIGGGFFRYATDPKWRTPHFEKMNYDNAELLVNYLHAYQATGKPLYREVAVGIMTYLDGRLSDRVNGGFFAHQDADMTREDDGDYYTWTVQEIRDALPPAEAEALLRYYDVRPRGEMSENPEKNVLFIAATPEGIAEELTMPVEKVRALIERGKRGLLQARTKRKTPLVDQTIYSDRNGMLISAYLEASQVLRDDQAKDFALKTLNRLLREAYREGEGMYHASFDGKARLPGLLNDQVQIAKASLDAFEITGERRYLKIAKELMDLALTHFWDSIDGGFFDRNPRGEALAGLDRPLKDFLDNPASSPNGVAARVLDRLAYLTNDERYEQKALHILRAFAGSAKDHAQGVGSYALALYYHLHRSVQAVIIGEKGDSRTKSLWESALATYRPGKMVAVYDPGELQLDGLPPAVAGAVKIFGIQGEPRAYVCAGSTCAPPTGDPAEVFELVTSFGVKKPEGPEDSAS